jgi:hypothetical protein
LNTSLIFVSILFQYVRSALILEVNQAGLFSAVSTAFIIDVQSKLEPDPNQITAAYMQILIHAVNSSLFPDADPGTLSPGPDLLPKSSPSNPYSMQVS